MNQCKASTATMTHTAAMLGAIHQRRHVRRHAVLHLPEQPPMWGSLLGSGPCWCAPEPASHIAHVASSVTDRLGVSHALNLRWAAASFENKRRSPRRR